MTKKPSQKTKRPKSQKGGVNIGGNASNANVIAGDNNVINLPREQIKINSLHQLPPPTPDFTGREAVIEELLKDFESSTGATISGLTGMGGIGKTALGLQVAYQLKDKYTDAQIFLDLKGTTAPLTAVDIARHVILSFEPSADVRGLDETNLQAAYQSILNKKRVLLFFDNARSEEQIAKLIPPNSCGLIVTSRWTFPVAGLKAHKVGVLEEKEATEFLLELCPRLANFAKELAKACGYLPLALRIAGSYLLVNKNSAVDKYLQELISVKSRLEAFAKNREQADLTSEPDVFATFELSYKQLSKTQQKMWRMLSVFPAPFDNSAVATMWGMDDTKNVDETLSLLMRYSLIDFNETSFRYEVHDLLGEFARSKMKNSEKEEAYYRHALHYMLVLQYANHLYGEGGEKVLAGLRLFDSEWEHIQNGQNWAAKNIAKNISQELICEYPNSGYMIFPLRLHPRIYINWLEAGLDSAKSLGNKKYQGFYLGNLGNAYYRLGEVKKAIEYFEQDLVIDREIGNRRAEGNALNNLGNAYADLGQLEKAIEIYEQALVISRETGNRQGEGSALGNLGNAYTHLGQLEKAIGFHKQALEIDREIGDKHGEASDLGNLGNAYTHLGQLEKAIEFYEQALEIIREIGDQHTEAIALGNLGTVYYGLGKPEHGVDLVKQALAIYEAIESPNAKRARELLQEWGSLT